jgi:hypothetical protein
VSAKTTITNRLWDGRMGTGGEILEGGVQSDRTFKALVSRVLRWNARLRGRWRRVFDSVNVRDDCGFGLEGNARECAGMRNGLVGGRRLRCRDFGV